MSFKYLVECNKIFQNCQSCCDSVSSRLENISSQLTSLTQVVLGLGHDGVDDDEVRQGQDDSRFFNVVISVQSDLRRFCKYEFIEQL